MLNPFLNNVGLFIRLFKKNYHALFLIILLAIGCIFAFYKFPYRYNLDDEVIRDVVVGIYGAKELQFPMIGSFSSTGPYTFGPWYFYQLIAFSFITKSFYAPWIYLGVAYLASILALFKIGQLIEDRDFGLILAALGTFSPALIIGSTHLTNPNLITVFALLSVLLFIKIIKKDVSYWWSFLFGLILGISINIHYQALSLLILPVLMLINKKKKIKYSLYFTFGIFLTFIPLLIFDANNHWFNLKNFTYYILHGKNLIYVPNRWLFYIRDFWPSYWGDVIGVRNIIALIMMICSGFIIAYQIFKRKIYK